MWRIFIDYLIMNCCIFSKTIMYCWRKCGNIFNLGLLIFLMVIVNNDGGVSGVEALNSDQQQLKPLRLTIEDLRTKTYPRLISNDLDSDICKAGGFMGDIALPNTNYEQEYLQLKKEVSEGLQVEEEGLTDYMRIKLKQAHIEETTIKPKLRYNDPVANTHLIHEQSNINNYAIENVNNLKSIKNIYDLKNTNLNDANVYVKKLQNETIENIVSNHNKSKLNDSENLELKQDLIKTQDKNDSSSNSGGLKTLEYKNKYQFRDTDIFAESTTPFPTVTGGDLLKMIATSPSTTTSSSSVTTEKGKRQRKRHRRRRRRFRKRKQNSFSEMEDRTASLNTESPSDFVRRRRTSRTTTTNRPLANSQSFPSTSKQKLVETVSSYVSDVELPPIRSSRSITNKKYTKPHESYERKRGKSSTTAASGKINDHIGQQSTEWIADKIVEIPVHEFEERFELKPPIKLLSKRYERNAQPHSIKDSHQTFFHNNEYNQHRLRVTRAATARKERIWDYGVIPYEIDSNFSGSHKALFKQAMRHWENSTCVKFVERVPDQHPNYIIFTERPCGCCSFVGKRGNGAQAISIGKNCDKFGIVVHELGHVVGFWHEHTRPDRDHHVQIFREHIMNGQEYNFNKLTEEEVNSLGLPYDYDSIMHYAKNTFSRGSYLDTIAPQENKIRGKPVPEIGQRLRLSQGDIAQTNLLYKCYKCGRTFQENSGAFSSPIYPNPSRGEPERCEWRITATHGERIVLNITELDIYKSSDCGSDYIEIRDGYWHKSPVLGRFCGSGRLTEPIVSTGSRMLVTYITSNKQLGRRGFAANYEAVCGGELTVSSSGHLESPNFPEDYLKNKECIWKLIVPPNYTVALRFQSFEIENHDNCVYDYVEVIDGFEQDSPVIGKFCGYKVPPDIKSTSNHLQVKFFSDSSVQKGGFSATFMKEYNECNQTDHGCEHDCINTLGSYECACRIGYELHSDGKQCEAACGGIFDTPNGTITSPSFPSLYPENKNCIWEIIAPPQFRITLNFTHFDLEGNNLYQQECDYDSVVVQSKLADDLIKKHGTYCGTVIPSMITSEGNSLRIIFNSDFTVQKSGFAAIFFTDMDECTVNNGGCQHECTNTIGSYKCSCHNGFTLHENGHDCKEGGCKFEITAPHGEILSPNYPDYYPSRKDCVWHFVTTPGHRIKLNFEKFEMEPHPDCAYDHIVLYDGNSPDARTLGRYCGSKIPHPIIASGNQMFMVFKSDASVQRKGFLAIHSTACGGLLQATNAVKHFYSHSRYGDYNYANRMDCEWTIQPQPRHTIILTFLTFELENEVTHCGYDFVQIFAGLDSSAYTYGKFCGTKIPSMVISNGEPLVVRFRSDDSIVSKGFSASYVVGEQFDVTDEYETGAERKDLNIDDDESLESF